MTERTVRSGQARVVDVAVPRYRAQVTAYIGPNADGSTTCVYVQCSHYHVSMEMAFACQDALEQRLERNPRSFPEVAAEMDRA